MPAYPFDFCQLVSRSRPSIARGVLALVLCLSGSLAAAQEETIRIEPELAKLLAADGAAGDRFGHAIAIDGDTVVVGARFKRIGGTLVGAAYVYQPDPDGSGPWLQVRKLLPTDGGGEFGISVAIDGDTVLVGAPSNAPGGAVFVFGRDVGGADNWGLVKKITAADAASGDDFGAAVALAGDTALIGSPRDDDAGSSSGSAYVFERNQGGVDNWGEVRKLTASDGAQNDFFGASVALDADTAVVGAKLHGDSTPFSGAAFIFTRNTGGANGWGEVKELTASDGGEDQNFGHSVAVQGDTVLVGAPEADSEIAGSGAVYAFERHHGGLDHWGEIRKLTNGDAVSSSDFGWSLALEGDLAVIGSPGHSQAGFFSGVAYLFSRRDAGPGGWAELWKLVPADLTAGDQFALAVAIGDGTAAVGAWAHDEAAGETGSAYAFRTPVVFLDGFESGDTSAWSVTVP